MSNNTLFIATLEQILTNLKNSKLEYLKASDRHNDLNHKRFFNLQSTVRNRYFQDIIVVLRSNKVEIDDLVINRLNFEQRLTSSLGKPKLNVFENCFQLDKKLLELYEKALDLDDSFEIVKTHKFKIEDIIVQNNQFYENKAFTLNS